MIPTVALPSGVAMPVLGQGTWRMGEDARNKGAEVAALKLGLDLGLGLIDTAEMYGEGAAEQVVAEAMAGRRDEVFLVSKVYPHNASRSGTVAACERSLKRLGTDRLDLYLLHWRGQVPLAETVAAFEALKQAGKIRDWGVSNFDLGDMEELADMEGAADMEVLADMEGMGSPGFGPATNQVLYNLTRRGVEFDLLPWSRRHGIPLMAYSPVEQGRLAGHAALARIAERHGASAAQIALAWLLHPRDIVVIPKAVAPAHVRENRAAMDLVLTPDDLAELDAAFPPPKRARPLEML